MRAPRCPAARRDGARRARRLLRRSIARHRPRRRRLAREQGRARGPGASSARRIGGRPLAPTLRGVGVRCARARRLRSEGRRSSDARARRGLGGARRGRRFATRTARGPGRSGDRSPRRVDRRLPASPCRARSARRSRCPRPLRRRRRAARRRPPRRSVPGCRRVVARRRSQPGRANPPPQLPRQVAILAARFSPVLGWVETKLASKRPETREVVAAIIEALRKADLSKAATNELRAALDASAKPPRDPSRIKKGMRGRGKKRG